MWLTQPWTFIMNQTLLWILSFLGALIISLAAASFIYRRRLSKRKVDAVPTSGSQLYVGNLSYALTDDMLKNAFNSFGKIATVRVIKHFKTGRSRGYGFVTYDCPIAAKSALSMHGAKLEGRSIVVRLAKAKST